MDNILQNLLIQGEGTLPVLPPIEIKFPLPEGLTQEDIFNFRFHYQTHLNEMMRIVLKRKCLGDLLKRFWIVDTNQNEEINSDRFKLRTICSLNETQIFVQKADLMAYQTFIDALIPNISRIPENVIIYLRNMAEDIQVWLRVAMKEYPKHLMQRKMESILVFRFLLRKYFSINDTAISCRGILGIVEQVNFVGQDVPRDDVITIRDEYTQEDEETFNVFETYKADMISVIKRKTHVEDWPEIIRRHICNELLIFVGTPQFAAAVPPLIFKLLRISRVLLHKFDVERNSTFLNLCLLTLLYKELYIYEVARYMATEKKKSIGEFLLSYCLPALYPPVDDALETKILLLSFFQKNSLYTFTTNEMQQILVDEEVVDLTASEQEDEHIHLKIAKYKNEIIDLTIEDKDEIIDSRIAGNNKITGLTITGNNDKIIDLKTTKHEDENIDITIAKDKDNIIDLTTSDTEDDVLVNDVVDLTTDDSETPASGSEDIVMLSVDSERETISPNSYCSTNMGDVNHDPTPTDSILGFNDADMAWVDYYYSGHNNNNNISTVASDEANLVFDILDKNNTADYTGDFSLRLLYKKN